MTIEKPDNQLQLPPEVLSHVMIERPNQAAKIAACLRTSASLLSGVPVGGEGLRLAESAAYNLREALDAVMSDQQPAAGGLPAVLDAWQRYQSDQNLLGPAAELSRSAFEQVVSSVAAEQNHSSWRGLKLLEYLRAKSGVDPLRGDLDPIAEYSGLLKEVNEALHSACSVATALSLHRRVILWFTRLFTPPDTQIRALRELARRPCHGPAELEELRRLATNPHHMGFFFSRITDPAWLDALYGAGLIPLPTPGEAWPATRLLAGLGRTEPNCVADLLMKLFLDSKNSSTRKFDRNAQLAIRFELLRTALHLGPAGYQVATQVLRFHGSDRSVRAIAVSIANQADPTDPIVATVADAVLSSEDREDRGHQATMLLKRLEAGLTLANAVERIKLVAAKARRAAESPYAMWRPPDIAALTTAVDEEQDSVVVIAHHFVRLAVRARELGISTTRLLGWANDIPGQLGERITCQLLANAPDVPLQVKIDHITTRLASSTATGDDRILVNDILSSNLAPEQIDAWAAAMGQPSPAPDAPLDARNLPQDWRRVWCWSIVLPAAVLASWRYQITQCTATFGELVTSEMDVRPPRALLISAQSPRSTEELTALPAIHAATQISNWRPDEPGNRAFVSARELARTLEAVIKTDLAEWTNEPTAIVTALREPVYVLHYFQTLAQNAGQLAERAPALLAAAALVRRARWEPAPIGGDDYDYEPGWDRVDTAIVELIAELANSNGHITDNLDQAWQWALAQTRDRPLVSELADPLQEGDALRSAINHPWGRGLDAVMALAGWEARNLAKTRSAFEEILDEVVSVPAPVGLEYRAILMFRRQALELAAPRWLDANTDTLFGDESVGLATFDLAIKWSHPTHWFLSRFQSQLFTAARRGTERATVWLLTGVLRGERGYTVNGVLDGLRGDVPAMRRAATEVALLVQNTSSDAPELAIAVQVWQALLDADRQAVPLDVLSALGRWTFVTGIDEQLWMELTRRTLELTAGRIDYSLEVADRCRTAQQPEHCLAMLLLLLGNGEPWEQSYINEAALDALRVAAQHEPSQDFYLLRTRLIERGRDEAIDITPNAND